MQSNYPMPGASGASFFVSGAAKNGCWSACLTVMRFAGSSISIFSSRLPNWLTGFLNHHHIQTTRQGCEQQLLKLGVQSTVTTYLSSPACRDA